MNRPDLLQGEDLPPKPKQQRSLEKQRRIRAAALFLFEKHGYEKTLIGEIAAEAGMPVGSFYQHYRSKRQPLVDLMDEFLRELAAMDIDPKATANLRAGLHSLLAKAFSAERKYFGAYRAWCEAVILHSDLREKDRAILAWTTARLQGAFSLLQKLPSARRRKDLNALAEIVDGLLWNLLAQAGSVSEKQMLARIDASTDLIFHALAVDP